MRNSLAKTFTIIPLCVLAAQSGCATKPVEKAERYTFSRWIYSRPLEDVQPRGGTTKGPQPKFAETHPGWSKLVATTGTSFDQDRAAILAMTGTFKASFEFLETMGFPKSYKLDRPYQSWGTEYVFAIAEEPKFISLQHIMVMFFEQDGKVQGPFVMKHWRQDWAYEETKQHRYEGNGLFALHAENPTAVKGTWTQRVYQVDDSPRYQVHGRWRHEDGFSVWQSENAWRPLPRREFSVRKDYNVLEGVHRITILPMGWVHEQDNTKLNLEAGGKKQYLAREAGLNHYEALADFDVKAALDYWEKTKGFWQEVRLTWDDIFARSKQFTFKKVLDDNDLYEKLFTYAEKAHEHNQKEWREFARKTIAAYVEEGKPTRASPKVKKKAP